MEGKHEEFARMATSCSHISFIIFSFCAMIAPLCFQTIFSFLYIFSFATCFSSIFAQIFFVYFSPGSAFYRPRAATLSSRVENVFQVTDAIENDICEREEKNPRENL